MKFQNAKKLLLAFLLFLSGIQLIVAEIKCQLKDVFSKYEESSSIGRNNTNFLTKFVGDTILFNFQDKYLDCFVVERPDTVWLKKRPKKNPVEGKHYILNYAYKGIQDKDRFVTPAFEINDKPFAIYNVKALANGEGCLIMLIDIENLDLITMLIPNSFRYDCFFTTVKTQRIINSLKDKDVYYSSDVPAYYSSYSKPEFTHCKVLGGDLKVNILKSSGFMDYKLKTISEIRLQGEDGSLISVTPINTSGYARANPVILTPIEYDNQFRGFKIQSDVEMDILNVEPQFPFTFIALLGKAKSSVTSVYQSVEPYDSYTTPDAYLDNDIINIGDILTVGRTRYYKGCLNGKAFFIKADDVLMTEKSKADLDTLAQQPQEIRNRFFRYQLALSNALYLDHLKDGVNKVESYSRYGLAIPNWSIYDMSEYTDGTGIKITFFNPTKSMIKYITLTFQGYNAVDDPVGRPFTKKCIGPINPEETASYDFEYAWFTDIVDYAKIKSIVVQYKNGTTKTISNPSSIVFSSELRDFFYSSNPVERLK